jgi:hypothetical protein
MVPRDGRLVGWMTELPRAVAEHELYTRGSAVALHGVVPPSPNNLFFCPSSHRLALDWRREFPHRPTGRAAEDAGSNSRFPRTLPRRIPGLVPNILSVLSLTRSLGNQGGEGLKSRANLNPGGYSV